MRGAPPWLSSDATRGRGIASLHARLSVGAQQSCLRVIVRERSDEK